MVSLSDLHQDPTLESMFLAMEAFECSKPRRGYMGASGLGHPCDRKNWFELNNLPKDPMKRQGIMATEDGHATEALVIERLGYVPGIELYTKDDSGKQFGFSKFEGKFRGHYDGIIKGILQAPNTWHIFEVKCCNEKKFAELDKLKEKHGEKSALKEWDYQFYIQAQLYMGAEQLYRHYLICATPGGRNMTSCRTEFNREVYDAMQSKAERIINAKEPPVRHTENKTNHICRWCDFAEVCWEND